MSLRPEPLPALPSPSCLGTAQASPSMQGLPPASWKNATSWYAGSTKFDFWSIRPIDGDISTVIIYIAGSYQKCRTAQVELIQPMIKWWFGLVVIGLFATYCNSMLGKMLTCLLHKIHATGLTSAGLRCESLCKNVVLSTFSRPHICIQGSWTKLWLIAPTKITSQYSRVVRAPVLAKMASNSVASQDFQHIKHWVAHGFNWMVKDPSHTKC